MKLICVLALWIENKFQTRELKYMHFKPTLLTPTSAPLGEKLQITQEL